MVGIVVRRAKLANCKQVCDVIKVKDGKTWQRLARGGIRLATEV